LLWSDCSKACQKADWPNHRVLCRLARLHTSSDLAFLKIASSVPGNFHRYTQMTEEQLRLEREREDNWKRHYGLSESADEEMSPLEDARDSLAERVEETAPASAAIRSVTGVERSSDDMSDDVSAASMHDSIVSRSPSMVRGRIRSNLTSDAALDDALYMGGNSSASDSEGDRNTDDEEEAATDSQREKASRRTVKSIAHQASQSLDASANASAPSVPMAPAAPAPTLHIQPIVHQSLAVPMNAVPKDSNEFLDELTRASSKELIQRTYGSHPRMGDACIVHYQGRYSSGAIFAKSKNVFFHGSSNAAVAAAAAVNGTGTQAAALAATMPPSSLALLIEGAAELKASPVEAAMFGTSGAGCPMRFVLGAAEVQPVWELVVMGMFRGETAVFLCRDEQKQLFIWELELVDFGSDPWSDESVQL
jgi:hypothetical protein